jgi:hypothetical protein
MRVRKDGCGQVVVIETFLPDKYNLWQPGNSFNIALLGARRYINANGLEATSRTGFI